jgi:hypothetical protein
MPELALDHLTIAAASLGEGIAFIEQRLGVNIPLGGKHPIMNTHNAVMRIGNGLYLEVISADPGAGPAQRPRWFGLDDPVARRRLDVDGPYLAAWVVRSDDIAATVAGRGRDLGEVATMSRGQLSWQIAIRPDGSVAMGGLMPLVIEWPRGPHPSTRMADLGVKFAGLTLRPGRPSELRNALSAIGADRLADIQSPKRGHEPLEAYLVRPDGAEVRIGGGDLAGAGP